MQNLLQDLRYAIRMLVKSPGFTLVAVLSLGLGIGGNAAIFSLVNRALIRPLPYAQPERLVRVTEAYPKGGIAVLQEQSRTMEVAAYLADSEFSLTGEEEPVHLTGSVVSANLLSLLGVPPTLGRTYEPGEDRPGNDRLVILSHGLWQTKFAGDPGIIGKPIMIDGVSRQVVGVMPPEFNFPSTRVQLWIPARFDPTDRGEFWEHGWMLLMARLRPEATLPQAEKELRTLIARIITLAPWTMSADWNANSTVIPLQEDLTAGLRDRLLLLLVAVGCVLLIVCVNVTCLLLARTTARQGEMALRFALGASRGRLVRQLLVETVVLALLGGGLGFMVAASSLSLLKSVLPVDNPLLLTARIDWQVLAFMATLSLMTGLAFGLAPALSASRLGLATAFRTRGQPAAGLIWVRLRSFLVVGEVTLAVVLVIGAALLIQSLWRLIQVDPGFRPEQIITLRIYPDQATASERAAAFAFYDELVRRARGLPGVVDVAAANTVPLSRQLPILPVELEGHPFIPGEQAATLMWAGAVTPEYFQIMRIPLLAGRLFTGADTEQSAKVVLASAGTARQFWPGKDAVGKLVRVLWEPDWRTVVGVVGDVRQYDLSGKSPQYISGALYMPYSQSVGLDRRLPTAMTLIVRTMRGGPQIAGELRGLLASLNPNVPVGEVRTLEAEVEASTSAPRSLMWVFISFGTLALTLAATGAYGVVSYWATQRTYEMGVRVALGATHANIFGLVLGQSLRLVLTGLALGVPASLAASRLIGNFLYGVTATDLPTFLAVGLLVVSTGLLAGYFPARRAAKVDPMVALRYE